MCFSYSYTEISQSSERVGNLPKHATLLTDLSIYDPIKSTRLVGEQLPVFHIRLSVQCFLIH